MKEQKTILFLVLLFVVSLVLMTLSIRRNQTISFFHTLFTNTISPFQSAITTSTNTISDIWSGYFNLVGLRKKNIDLRKQIDQLKEENSRYREQNLHSKRLLKLFDVSKKHKNKTEHAEIIGVDTLSWSKVIFINKGKSNSSIKNKMAVLTPDGLVGQIIETSNTASSVLLMTDLRSSVDILFQRDRTRGVAVGLNKDYCFVKYVPSNADIQIGDRAITTGLGGVFPKGILVGTVRKITNKKHGLFQDVELTPSADLKKLEDVLILTK